LAHKNQKQLNKGREEVSESFGVKRS